MNKESIYAVSDERSVRLLIDKRFSVMGQASAILDDNELRRRPVYSSSLQSIEDKLEQVEVFSRNINEIAEAVRRHAEFDLLDYRDAALIYYCVDKFLYSQFNLCYGNPSKDMLDDFILLEKVANVMLTKMDLYDRSVMPNTVRPPKAKQDGNSPTKDQLVYNSIFRDRVSVVNTAPADAGDILVEPENDPIKYNNPFKSKLTKHQVNSLDRFK